MADPPVQQEEEEEAPPAPPAVASVVSDDHAAAPPIAAAPFEAWQQQQPWNAPPQSHPAVAMAQFYEARMRDHAAAYASAAAGAAWAAAQIANSATMPPVLPHHMYSYTPEPWHPPPQTCEERPGKRQQTMPAENNLSETKRQPQQHSWRNKNHSLGKKRGRRRPGSDHNTSSDTHESFLYGKTAVSALHEWCDKQKILPKFILLPTDEIGGFRTKVELNGTEWGRGRGGTKASAKQDAARQALQALLPNVAFDANGILVAPIHKKRHKPSALYSSTSEEENDYYASRGASVCSALLHAMWQIDDCIPEPPSYSYDVCANPVASNKRNKAVAGVPSTTTTATAAHRSSFLCTARLVVKQDNDDDAKTLTAVGTAATKREARHAASAKLLAMLFPECNGMVEVKAAAEAKRERYAASKAAKIQSKREAIFPKRKRIDYLPGNNNQDPPLPDYFSHQLRGILVDNSDDVESEESTSKVVEESTSRSLSRKKQLDEKVDAALQMLNEVDDEGRSLPDDSDDVGRTVLRRAQEQDAVWIRKLNPSPSHVSPLALSTDEETLRLWGGMGINLLLCRAIAPYDDPPLGCAVLTLGFSMTKGRTLRVAEIVSEPHLPQERFLECLEKFACQLDCSLEESSASEDTSFYSTDQLQSIVESLLKKGQDSKKTCDKESTESTALLDLKTIGKSLQSVQEETEEEHDKQQQEVDTTNTPRAKSDKPCKRSRVV